MEVGAVKQAFNNEIILLKKNLNQAKTQTIHKLTRKAKTLTEKNVPEPQKEKLKRKAASAVKEVLIIKKIKTRDIARFIVTHTGKLNDHLNKPIVDNNKACARLLLHKALQDKYKHIREKFSNISIKDLFMSRQERLKLKKEAKERQKNKKKGKGKSDAVNVEGEWDVDMTNKGLKIELESDKIGSDDEFESKNDKMSDDSDEAYDRSQTEIDDKSENEHSVVSRSDESNTDIEDSVKSKSLVSIAKEIDSDHNSSEVLKEIELTKKTKLKSELIKDFKLEKTVNKVIKHDSIIKFDKKITNKNKNLNRKLEKRDFHKVSDSLPTEVNKMVDPFFITSTGENYLSLVEPRQPDEVKEVHKEGNRQYRRAVMFGHAPKMKPKSNNIEPRNKNNSLVNHNKGNKNFDKKPVYGFKNVKANDRNDKNDSAPEKLHPSWEAKKKQSGILPFKGKKIVFDES